MQKIFHVRIKKERIRRGRGLVGLCFLLGLLALPAWGNTESSQETLETWLPWATLEEKRPAAETFRLALLQLCPETPEETLWEELWQPSPPEKKAALGLGLMEKLFPQGNPSGWEEVGGFWHPSLRPRSLAALDALFLTLEALLMLPNPEAAPLGALLLKDGASSSRTRELAFRRGPKIYRELCGAFEKRHLVPPGGWPRWKGYSTLPLAQRVRGTISPDAARGEGFLFLDGAGKPARGMGTYLWNRRTGRIYRVRMEERRPLYIPLP